VFSVKITDDLSKGVKKGSNYDPSRVKVLSEVQFYIYLIA
jgi:hypothetical protein